MTNRKYNFVHLVLILGAFAIALPAFAALDAETSLSADSDSGIKVETHSMMHVDGDEEEHGGTEDIHIGIDEMHEETEEHMDEMHEEMDEHMDEMMGEDHDEDDGHDEDDEHHMHDGEVVHGNRISVRAIEVRGWDAETKAELLAEVKTHAEVNSEHELEHFAQGTLLKNEDVESIEVDESKVRVRTHVPAKFLGVINTTVEGETTITFGDGEHGSVKVKFPWYRFFFKMDDRFNEESVAASLLPEIDDEVLVHAEASMKPSMQASIIAKVIAYFKGE